MLNILDFGAVGDGNTNDFTAIKNALDTAGIKGERVYVPAGVYNIDDVLVIPAGVTIYGEGRGGTSLATPSNGSVIRNTGTSFSMRIADQNCGIRDLSIIDTNNAGAEGGIELFADNTIIESAIIQNVLIFGFTTGVALKLRAQYNGGIYYCTFYDLRIRHAGTGILIEEEGVAAVNSNTFYHGAISGGDFDTCIHIKAGNNNVFYGMIMEPPSSTVAHLLVESGQIIGNNIRIEGTSQPANIPLIQFNAGTENSEITGIYSGGLTIDNGNNYIGFHSTKNLDYANSNTNLFKNSNFQGVVNDEIPFWELTGNNLLLESQTPQIMDDQQVIKLTVPAGETATLRPIPLYLPKVYDIEKYKRVNFGIYAKTNTNETVTTICQSTGGVEIGPFHPGDDQWHLVGMSAQVSQSISYDAKFFITNVDHNVDLIVYLSTPTLNFGYSPVKLDPQPITSAGGVLTGTITTGLTEVDTVSGGFLVLPKDANVFTIKGTHAITRINHTTADRFPAGTVITLSFADANIGVTSSGYINLLSGYTSTLNSSLTLLALGNGTWRELGRNL